MKWAFPLAAVAALFFQQAFGDTTLGVVLPRVPITIIHPGVYHLTADLVFTGTTGAAITIAAPGAVIDMNGHELISAKGAGTEATGVYCDGYNRVTIKDGNIIGFGNGVFLLSDGATAKDLLVTTCYKSGIEVVGNNTQILHNRVCSTGGSSVTSSTTSIGIAVTGTYATVTDNDVQDTFVTDVAGHEADGILIKDASHVVASNNRVLDVEPAVPAHGSSSIGIDTQASDNLILLGNTVVTAGIGIDLSGGSSGDYGDNITSDPANNYGTTNTGMVSIGNNN